MQIKDLIKLRSNLEHEKLTTNQLIETSFTKNIERAFKRVKDLKILSNLPNNMAGLSSEIFSVCANFQKPLVMNKD